MPSSTDHSPLSPAQTELHHHRRTSTTTRSSIVVVDRASFHGDDVEGLSTYKSKTPIRITRRGADILHDPLFNKSDAFGLLEPGERDRLRIRGLLPFRCLSIEEQSQRFLQQLSEETSDIKKNLLLEDLHDNNETLYHRLLVDHFELLAPLVYTPTVGQACQEFAHRYRRPRGMYLTQADRGAFAAMVYNWPRDVHVIVVTDGSRILGLGDLGANGMGIPIGKLSLYCAAGGIAPHRVLPVVLDVGTDNQQLLKDPFYLGWPEPRLRGPPFFELVQEFMEAVTGRWPHALVQFEDFSSDVAQPLLNMFREDYLCFNDDIQGTGATVLAGIMGALRAIGQSPDDLGQQRILILGAGSAGIGIGQVLMDAMIIQGATPQEAADCFYVVDQYGLLGVSRGDQLNEEQKPFARNEDGSDKLGFVATIEKYKPNIMIGVTGVKGLFTEEAIKACAAANGDDATPIIFALSNPTSKAECTAEQAYKWTNGNCIFASGSPFPPVTMPDGRVLYTSQCNNFYLFPGLGLGGSACAAQKITDKMIYLGSKALAEVVPEEDAKAGKLFPPRAEIREASKLIACAVIQEAWNEGLTRAMTEADAADIPSFVEKKMYYPEYVPLIEKRTVVL